MKPIKFHNTPAFTREFVNNWLTHAKKHKHPAVHIAVLEDMVQLIDVAITVLDPVPTESANNQKTTNDGKDI